MKGLGLAGAGLGAAAAVVPTFHDLDEVISSKAAIKHPWFVKERDILDPTFELDWNMITRIDNSKNPVPSAVQDFGPCNHPLAVEARANLVKLSNEYVKSRYPEWQGDTTRDIALSQAARALAFYDHYTVKSKSFFTGLEIGKTPEANNVPKWQGTPEENLRTLQAAIRVFGGQDVGCVELNEKTKKLVFAVEQDGKPYVFEDVEKPYETETKRVIPNRSKYVIVWTQAQPTQLTLREPSTLGKSATSFSYTRLPVITVQLQEFLRGLGYTSLIGKGGGFGGGMTCSAPFGALAGMGEHSRASDIVTSPYYGNTLRGMCRMVTDLPVAPTRPIDAGVGRFCVTCKKCAENCPFSALPMGDKSWEHESKEEGTIAGYNGWRLHNLRCPRCANCQATCVFDKVPEAGIHEFIRGAVATTSVFNSFFRKMDDMFGYGFQDPESWWGLEHEPTWGVDVRYTQH